MSVAIDTMHLCNKISFLDRAMQLDKKHMPEYVGTMEATIEIQSLQIVGFLSMVS